MVSGDDKACLEARRLIPGIVAVQVKKGLSCQGGLLLSQVEAHKRIRDGAAEAVGRCRSVKPLRFRKPVTMRLELVSRGTVPMRKAGVKVIDGRTYEVKGRSVEEALNNL
jgi:D-aminopeptidase